ncbi:MAG: phosphate/phosphite/phosphonate ABC transporter substrate-binding protein [Rubrobacteraceae bacterium]
MAKPIIVGAVLYDPKVSVVWDIIREFFEENGCPIDVVFYTNYELQVEALINGHLDMAWNSPLAWLDSQRRSGNACRAIAMRDTDRDRVSHIVTRKNGGVTKVEDLRGKTVAVGAKDSPQATLIPLGFLQRQGLQPGEDFQVKRFDVLVGKHGDHVGGELDAFKCLESGEAEASTMLDLNWDSWTQDGTINPNEYEILGTTDDFDHCVFTVREDFDADVEKEWLDVLFSMSYSNPDHREMMDLEGLQEWMVGRTTGFGPLSEATEEQQFFEDASA